MALGFTGVKVSGLEGWMTKRKYWRMGPKRPRGSITKESKIMCWSRMSQMTVSPMVVVPVVGLVLLSCLSFFFLYFCRCELALAKTSKGVNHQRKQDHVLVKNVTNDCVANGGGARCWVGFVVVSELLLFVFL